MCYGAAAASVSPRSSPPPRPFPTSTTRSSPPAGSGSTRSTSPDGSRPSRLTRRSDPSLPPFRSHYSFNPSHSFFYSGILLTFFIVGRIRWSKEEQSAAIATATDTTLQELVDWNIRYQEKFGFVFLICASGRGTPEILAELKKRYVNRPIVELEIAAQEEMKIIELRLARLVKSDVGSNSSAPSSLPVNSSITAGGSSRTRPPITTHVLDIARGSPASGMDVHLEMWKGTSQQPLFSNRESTGWVLVGSSTTNTDGRSGQLMGIVDHITPGFYRISFDTGKYAPSGFFPYVSIVFQVRKNQTGDHFHVPLLHAPFSFSTYRGS
ncbi:uric acid degradation bifunctional protein TTL-like isoform X1 [Zingiber officinale]|uniref:uric acid degradation bifunctional protein TTL-like isoform X1 n=1 Tax=Zingiber officinale TaxID=94328 RepID=UPI001C4B6CC4|nr:uric acid degradation bifunctional protein TTL-like isoform X1 [Zingiber officinale]